MNAKPLLAGVIGWPVAHSLSPRVHRHWLRTLGIAGDYVPLAVRPDDLAAAVAGLRALGFAGANVTVPHKAAVLPLLDSFDEIARRAGGANTLVVGADGAITGTSTDGYGFLENLRGAIPGWTPAGAAVVVGGGGAARAIAVALADAGVADLRIVNRTPARGEEVAAAAGGAFVPWAQRAAALGGAALLINATSLGMTGAPPLDLPLGELPGTAVVTDIVYAPLETPLLRDARARGNPVVDGLGMLLHQARPGFAAWFGAEPEVTADLRAFVLGRS